MSDLQKPISQYLTEKGNIVRLILFTSAFALLFINIYAPFGVETWYNVTRWQLLLFSSLVILTGVLVVVVSRMIMYHWCKKHSLLLWQYLVWVVAEVFFMALFYALYEKWIVADSRFFPDLLKNSIQNTALVLLLPYSATWLFFSWREKKIKLETLSAEKDVPDSTKNMIPFHDEKGILRLSVKAEHLLYIESSDNYVTIYYLNKEKIVHFMMRNTMKKLEEQLEGSMVIRCHRSFIINFEKVKILRREKDGLHLELDVPEALQIPVSKSYIEKVMQVFTRFSV
ncbi:MAG: LytTR family transcriptional regulator [Lentimicrobiaceae bacterium]|jgi:hypothetical protein|nr:LytTR family transcriptional regulator [Lentimicrobiaceae bacterium]